MPGAGNAGGTRRSVSAVSWPISVGIGPSISLKWRSLRRRGAVARRAGRRGRGGNSQEPQRRELAELGRDRAVELVVEEIQDFVGGIDARAEDLDVRSVLARGEPTILGLILPGEGRVVEGARGLAGNDHRGVDRVLLEAAQHDVEGGFWTCAAISAKHLRRSTSSPNDRARAPVAFGGRSEVRSYHCKYESRVLAGTRGRARVRGLLRTCFATSTASSDAFDALNTFGAIPRGARRAMDSEVGGRRDPTPKTA